MLELSVRHPLAADARAVIDAIWSGAEWAARWSPVRAFDVGYDDGHHQEARLSVEWDGRPLELRVVRFRVSPVCIEFFCPSPPHPLAAQSGRWAVESGPDGPVLVASRSIEVISLASESEEQRKRRQDDYARRLAERLGRILPLFARLTEGI